MAQTQVDITSHLLSCMLLVCFLLLTQQQSLPSAVQSNSFTPATKPLTQTSSLTVLPVGICHFGSHAFSQPAEVWGKVYYRLLRHQAQSYAPLTHQPPLLSVDC